MLMIDSFNFCVKEYGELFVPSFSNHCSTSLDTDLIRTELINIFTTPCIQFDERLLPGLSPVQAQLCRRAFTGLVGSGNDKYILLTAGSL